MNGDALSARQLSVAVLVGGLSAAAAGRADWRWALLALPVGVLLGWLVLRRTDGRPLYRGPAGGVLAAAYGAWAVVLMAWTLRRAAGRLQIASGGQELTGWLLVLLALPLLWMGWGKAAAFFRAVEIFWLAMVAVLAVILVLGGFRVEWRYLVTPGESWWESMLAMGGVLAVGLFVLPYIYKVKGAEKEESKGLAWLAVLGVITAALWALTAGLLSPSVAACLKDPFFTAAGVLGESARIEGLVSALWLLPDLTLAGLLSRVWGAQRWPAAAVLLALGLALTGITERLPALVFPCGAAVLLVLTLILPGKEGKIVVEF